MSRVVYSAVSTWAAALRVANARPVDLLLGAQIIAIDPHDFFALGRRVERYLSEHLGAMYDLVGTFPDPPFPVVFIGLDGSVSLDEDEVCLTRQLEDGQRVVHGYVLIGETDSTSMGVVIRGRDGIEFADMLHYPKEMQATVTLTIQTILKRFEDRPISARPLGFTDRRRLKKAGVTRPPQVYYRVELSDRAPLRPQGDSEPTGITMREHDVVAHWRLLTRRGTGEVSEELRGSLAASGYAVVDAEADPVLVQAVASRGVSNSGGWLAAKLVRVRSHRRGSGDYVPAMRVV